MVLKQPLQVLLHVLLFGFVVYGFQGAAGAEPAQLESSLANSRSETMELSASKRRHARAPKRRLDRPRSQARLRPAAVGRKPRAEVSNPYLLDEQASIVRTDIRESDVVAEARRWIDTNPTGRSSLWCATFMNFVLERTGRAGTGSDLARSFASYGQLVYGPQIGAIAVMSRGKTGGHVGVVSGIDEAGNPIVVSGNYGRKVAEAAIPHSRIYAYVMPM